MTESVHPVLVTATQFRQQLLRNEDVATQRLAQFYTVAFQRLGTQIEALVAVLDGQVMTPSQAAEIAQLRAFQQAIVTEITRFGVAADLEMSRLTTESIELALNHSTGLVEAYFQSPEARAALRASFTSLVPEQVETLAGFLAPESPLHDALTEQLGNAVAEQVSSKMVESIARGANPLTVAAEIRRDLGLGLSWAVNTVRTANLWAYREATRANYIANSRVVGGWTWHATLDNRVCGSCLSQHGTQHELTETLNGHHQCRCVMIPELPLAKSLGLELPEIETGEDWFRRQQQETQNEILGLGMAQAWRDGQVQFSQFSREYQSEVYGSMLRMASMKDLGVDDDN